jgi:hypothetical protein
MRGSCTFGCRARRGHLFKLGADLMWSEYSGQSTIRGRLLSAGVRLFDVLTRRNPRDVQANVDAPAYGQFFNSVERSFGATFWIDR